MQESAELLKAGQHARALKLDNRLVNEIVQPKIIRPLPAPTLSYTALSAVRQWRFTPAKLDGQIVPFIWNLTVNFKLD